MFDKFSRALALMREAFEDAQAGVGSLPCVDLAAEVDGAQQVINAGCAVQALRVAQYAARVSEQDACGQWVEVDQPLGQVGEFAADCFGPMLAMGPIAAGRKVKAAKERLERFVQAYPSRVPGLTTWVASLPAADSAACWAAIDDLAHRMRGDDPTRTLEQCRADALVDLMLTRSTNASARHCS